MDEILEKISLINSAEYLSIVDGSINGTDCKVICIPLLDENEQVVVTPIMIAITDDIFKKLKMPDIQG